MRKVSAVLYLNEKQARRSSLQFLLVFGLSVFQGNILGVLRDGLGSLVCGFDTRGAVLGSNSSGTGVGSNVSR